jgi:5-hydroxyisourate hydrolase
LGKLTTHVLDTALGRPAAGLRIEVWREGLAPELKSPHPPVGHLLPSQGGREKANASAFSLASLPETRPIISSPSPVPLRMGEGAQRADEGSLVATNDSPETLIKTITTNADGRADAALLEGAAFVVGHYELRFYAGDYLRGQGLKLAEPLFLDVIPIRFGIADAAQHFHVPLLLSPFGYSTYRGS